MSNSSLLMCELLYSSIKLHIVVNLEIFARILYSQIALKRYICDIRNIT